MTMVPVRMATVTPDEKGTRRLLQHGGRMFVFRDMDGSFLGDRLCTLPQATGEVVVLAPRGFGRPLLARKMEDIWRGLPNGEPCSMDRWRLAGGVAAWLHAVDAPHRHFPLLAVGGDSIGSSVVVVVRAKGLASVELKSTAVRVLEGVPQKLEIADGLVVRWENMSGDPRQAVSKAERGLSRLKNLLPDIRAGIAATEVAALELSECVDAGWIGLVPEKACAAWGAPVVKDAGLSSGRRVGRWQGPAIPDIDGLISLARSMGQDLPSLPTGGVIRVGLHGEKGFCFFRLEIRPGNSSSQVAGQIAASLCERFFQVGSVHALSISMVEEGSRSLEEQEPASISPQLALLPW